MLLLDSRFVVGPVDRHDADKSLRAKSRPPDGIMSFLCTETKPRTVHKNQVDLEATRALGPGLNPVYCGYPLEGDPVHPLVPKDGSRVRC